MNKALRVVVTGAAGQIGYSLIGNIANGSVFGDKQMVILHMLDIEPALGILNGLGMEIQDCCFAALGGVIITHKLDEAFKDVDFAFMVGSVPRKEGMERCDLLKENVKIFKEQGEALDKSAKKTVKVIVVGNPANTNCFILSKYAPSIPKENFTALTRLDHNRAVYQIANKLGIPVTSVRRVVVWGNHSGTQYPDFTHGLAKLANGKEVSVKDAVKDDNWLQGEFIKTVQSRGGAVIAARKLSSAMSAAKAICDHARDWFKGSSEWVSMAVYSDGSYDTPKDVFFSFPVTIKNGKWSIVQGLKLDDFSKEKLASTSKELEAEKGDAIATCG